MKKVEKQIKTKTTAKAKSTNKKSEDLINFELASILIGVILVFAVGVGRFIEIALGVIIVSAMLRIIKRQLSK